MVIVGAARRQAETFLEADQTDAAVVVGAGHVSAARCRVRITLVGLPTTLLRRLHTRTPRRGAAVSGVRRTNEVNARRARLVLGRVTVFRRVYTISVTVCNKPTGSTQPCITPGSLNRVPASTGGKGGNVSSVGWQVTLCDHVWHVSSRSGVAG